MEFTHLVDPSHGWFKVKRDYLIRLGVLNKITGYSYQRNGFVYLEEDCDASTFFNHLDALGKKWEVVYKPTNRASKVRGYDQFELRPGEGLASGLALHTVGSI